MSSNPSEASDAPRRRRNRRNRVCPLKAGSGDGGGAGTEAAASRDQFFQEEMKLAHELHTLYTKQEVLKREIRQHERAVLRVTNPFCRRKVHGCMVLVAAHLSRSEQEAMLRARLAYLRAHKQHAKQRVSSLIRSLVTIDLERGNLLRRREQEAEERAGAGAAQFWDYEVECEKISWKLSRLDQALHVLDAELRRVHAEKPGEGSGEGLAEGVADEGLAEGVAGEGLGEGAPGEGGRVRMPAGCVTVEEKAAFLYLQMDEMVRAQLRLKQQRKRLRERRKQQKQQARGKQEGKQGGEQRDKRGDTNGRKVTAADRTS